MNTDRNILIAFVLNFFFSIFELFGGIITGSVAIISDAFHDLGDAVGIAVSYLMERKSKKTTDDVYTYGYARYSVFGSLVTTFILIAGSLVMIYNAAVRLLNPVEINYDRMLIFAVVGVVVNFGAAFFTRDGHSLNEKAVNLHMLEDVLGWTVVLIGAVVMRFTDFWIIDPVMSIAVSLFILVHSIKNLKAGFDVLLEKTPNNVSVSELCEHIKEIGGVIDVHHVHVWTIDGMNSYATLHVVTDADSSAVKSAVKEELREHGICHATVELEGQNERCNEECCKPYQHNVHGHCHHHH
ncbi:MAG: cation transporter [Clostridia bacterium]|nr:cation transporter [Clostridia bacterium]MBQ5808719.1 cation transporter [Clostridia bacterium]